MQCILIAHRDGAFAEQLASELRASRYYTVLTCPGPWPPMRCVRCDKGYCPLTEAADLMIYDPQLTAGKSEGDVHRLAIASALAHPDVPMLLAWPPEDPPDTGTLREIRSQAPNVRLAAHGPQLVRQVEMILSPAPNYA